jgi:GT2 family glycosyltransferase
MSQPSVSVVIVTYNSRDDVEECLRSVIGQDYPSFEVMVVDNDSTDGTVELVEKSFPSVEVIRNHRNYGPAEAYNIGINACKGTYVVLLNPDTVAEGHWLSELVRVMDGDKDVGACQSKVLFYDKRDTINTEGNEVNYLGFAWCRNYGTKDSGGEEVQSTLGLSVCSAVLRRDVLEKAGSFDGDFFAYLDDTDLGLRIYRTGHKVVCNPRSVVYHKYEFRRGKKKFYYLERNRLMLLLKHYRLTTLLRILPAFGFMELGLVLLSVRQGWFKEKMLSYVWIVRNWGAIRSKRRAVRREKGVEKEMLNMMSPTIGFEEIDNPILNRLVNPVLKAYYRLLVCCSKNQVTMARK